MTSLYYNINSTVQQMEHKAKEIEEENNILEPLSLSQGFLY